MSLFLKKYVFTIIALVAISLSIHADSDRKYKELEQRTERWHVEYFVNDDFSLETTTDFQVKALTENAVKYLKKYSFSYSTSIESAEILEAYTLKSGGKKILVPKDNYQVTVNQGSGTGGPVFSDRTKMTVVFPDFENGDSIAMRFKVREKEPMFPNNFAISQYFYSEVANDDVQIAIDFPEKISYTFKNNGMKEKVKVKDGRKRITLSYKNKKPLKVKRKDFSVWSWENESGFAISTFDNYREIADAYGARATPKAQPNKRVTDLAKKIVGRKKDNYEKARLLYEWVAQEITYAGNCIGIGAVVPHDLDFVLDNKMGDCKDQATLLQALLSSVGVKSVQALINSGSLYSLPEVPMVTSVNHVIIYIPEFDKFVDPTNYSMPFDLLGFQVSDKPVLLVGDYKEGMKTPASTPELNSQVVNAKLNIQPDGSVKGGMDVAVKGYPAAQVRSQWRNVTEQAEKEWLKQSFSSSSKIGSGTIEKEDPKPLSSEYAFSYEFDRPEFLLAQGAGGLYVGPIAYSPYPIASYLTNYNEDIEGHSVVCSNGVSKERIEYIFPENMRVLAKPDNFSIEENYLAYSATYTLEGNTLLVKREIYDKTPGNTCLPEIINAQRETVEKINKNFNSQVVYQYF